MKPAISIIVPIHNVDQYLEGCIESILNQTFKDFEVLLINDGSTDKSGVICDKYEQKDNRIKVIHKEYGGVSSARNAGLNISRGHYIGFVDGDDRIDKHMYKTLFELCKETSSDISICKLGREINGNLINKETKSLFIKEMNHVEAMRQLFKGELYRFSLCNKLFRNSCFNKIQFPEGRIHEDLATTYKLIANATHVVYTNYIGYIYIKRQNSILTSRFNEDRLDAFIAWDEILTFMAGRYRHIIKEIIASFGYWCVDNIYYILNQVENKKLREEYLSDIQKIVRKFYIKLMLNKSLSIKYKLTITLLQCSTNIFILSSNSKRFLRVSN